MENRGVLGRISKYFVILGILSLIISWEAKAVPPTFSYQGRIMNSQGQGLEYQAVAFEFTVTSPDGSCVLYKEQRNGVDMRNSKGVFDTPIGSGTKSYPSTPGFTLLDAFDNSHDLTCDGGATYSPAVDDGRRLRVLFHDGTGWKMITPDSFIRSVPFSAYAGTATNALTAANATKLGNKPVTDFVVKTGIPDCVTSGKILTYNGTAFSCVDDQTGAGTITGVNGSGPIVVTGMGTLTISANVGTTTGTLAAGDDSRFTNARTPTGAASGDLTGNYPAPTIVAGAVGTTKIADSAVTTIKVADSAITSVKIADGTIAPADLAAGSADGQVLRYNNSAWEATKLKYTDLVNDVGASPWPASCAPGEYVTWLSVADGFDCVGMNIGNGANQIPQLDGSGKLNSSVMPDAVTNGIWESGSGNVYRSTGNVGIKKNNPQVELDVNGTIRATNICDESGGNCKDISTGWGAGGSVTSVTAGSGLVTSPGAGITTSGSIGLDVELAAINALSTTGFVKRTGTGAYSTSSSLSLTTDVSGVLPIANGGTNSNTALTNNQLMYSASGAIKELGAMSGGQVVVGKTGAAPQIVTLGGDATISDTGSLALATGAVTSGKILDGTINAADMDFTGSNAATTGLVMKDSGGKFFNFICSTPGDVPMWTASGFACQAVSITETDPKVGTNATNYLSKWDGSQLVTSGVFENSGKVGIGTGSPSDQLTVTGGNIVATGTYGSGDSMTVSGAGTRMFWYPRKAAFRAGTVSGTAFDDGQIGNYSTAFGENATASGVNSFAANRNTTASGLSSAAFNRGTASSDNATAFGNGTAAGSHSVAMGTMSAANGNYSLVMGTTSIADGHNAFAAGNGAAAPSFAQVAIGQYNAVTGSETAASWVATDPLFVIGIGADSSTRASAVTVLKNGNFGIGTANPQALLDVNGVIRATNICDETGSNCKDISAGWGAGGSVTSVTAGTGLATSPGGGITTSGSIGIAASGVTATELASNAVTTAKIADGNVTGAKLEDVSGLTAGAYGSSTAIPAITVDAKGRVTAVSTNAITGLPSAAASSGKYLKSDGTNWSGQDVRFSDIKNSMGGSAFDAGIAGCTTAQTVKWSVLTDTFECQNIAGLDADKITTGVIATARLGTGTASSSTFLRGDGTWDTPTFTETDPKVDSSSTNYLPKWDGSKLVDSAVIESSGKVGIGIAGPSATLQVVDGSNTQISIGPSTAANANAQLSLIGKNSGTPHEAMLIASWIGDFRFKPAANRDIVLEDGNGTDILVTQGSTARVGIKTGSPGSELDVNGTIRATAICDRSGSNCKTISGGWTAGTVTQVTAGAPLAVTNSTTTPNITIPAATASVDGYLASSDFTTFNSKLGAVTNTASLANGKIWVGDAGGKAQEQTPGGDVTMNASASFTVAKLQNRTVASTAPTLGTMLKWNDTLSQWEPWAFTNCVGASQALHYTSASDTWSCDTISVTSATGTLPIANGGTGATTAADALTALLPSQSGKAGQFLKSDGTSASWDSVSATPAGADTQVQFNNSGSLGASASFVWDNTNSHLNIAKAQNGETTITVANSSNTTSASAAVEVYNNNGFQGAITTGASNHATPGYKDRFVVESSANAGGLTLRAASSTVGDIRFIVGGWDEKMRIANDGKVGIATSSPGSELDVDGTIRATEICDRAGSNCKTISGGWGGNGTVTSVTAGTGLVTSPGGGITTTGSIELGTELAGVNALSTTGFVKRTAAGAYSTVTALDLSTADVTGTLPISKGGTGQISETAAFNALSPLTTKGDLLTRDSSNNIRLAVGGNGKVLKADSGQASGLTWGDPVATDIASLALTGIVQRDGTNSFSTVTVSSPLTYTGGTLGVNTTSNGVLLDGGNTVSAAMTVGTNAAFNLEFKTDSTSRMVLDTSGNLSVGAGSSPQAKLDVNGGAAVNASFEGISTYVNSSTAYTIPDLSVNIRRITLTGNATITLPAYTSPTVKVYTLTVFLKQDGTGSRTVTFAGNGSDTVKWDAGSAPTISGTAGKITILQLTKPSDETVWYGSMVWKEN